MKDSKRKFDLKKCGLKFITASFLIILGQIVLNSLRQGIKCQRLPVPRQIDPSMVRNQQFCSDFTNILLQRKAQLLKQRMQLSGKQKEDNISSDEDAENLEERQVARINETSQNINYLTEYYRLLNLSSQQKFAENSFIPSFISNHIRFDSQVFEEHLKIIIQHRTNNYQAIKVRIEYGYFSSNIDILNVDIKNSTKILAESFAGSFGDVYKYQVKDDSFAIKSIKIRDGEFTQIFREAIKEYFLLMVAAALGVGPSLVKLFGFDLVVFRDSIAFSMEFCEMNNYRINASLPLLKQKLHLLHSLKMVHLDIKPENIAFSPRRNEYVFIDFGLSQMIKEGLGSKTRSTFMGSFNYCSAEMLELYLKDEIGMVDLYYNDAFCLDKSLKKLENLQIQLPYDLLFVNRPNLQQLQQCITLYNIQYVLFTLSLSKVTETSIFSEYRSFMRKKRLQLHNFILTLPQSFNFISLYKREFKKLLNFEEYDINNQDETLQREIVDKKELTQFFQQRLTMITNICSDEEWQFHRGRTVNLYLDNQEQLKNTRIGLYQLALIKHIKFNSNETKLFTEKIKSCQVFNQLYLKILDEIDESQLYRRTVKSLFQTSLTLENPQNSEILQHSIETVVILQLISENELTSTFVHILQMQIEFVRKISLCFQFITSLQFIKERYRTSYSYDKLTVVFMTKLNDYFNNLQHELLNQVQKNFVLRLKLIISNKILLNEQINEMMDQNLSEKPMGSKKSKQINFLNQKISLYILSHCLLSQIDKLSRYKQKYFKLLLIWLNHINQSTQHFIFPYFALYAITYKTNQQKLNQQIFDLFHSQFKNFEEHKYFKIYLLNKLSKVKLIFSQKLLMQKNQEHIARLGDNEAEIEYQQIFQIMNYIVENNKKFHQEIGFLFAIIGIYSNFTFIDFVKKLIYRHRQKLSKISLTMHENGKNLHNNKLKQAIWEISGIFELIKPTYRNQQYQKKILLFVEECKQFIEKSVCFRCKVAGLFELKIMYANYLSYCEKFQQSFLCAANLLVVFLKNVEYQSKAFITLIGLLRRWCRNDILNKKYDLQPFLFEFITRTNKFYYCLVDIREYNIFLNLYLFVASMNDKNQMTRFILNVINELANKKSIPFINNFYFSLISLININKKNKFLPFFKDYHDAIVDDLLDLKDMKRYKFVALYFSALLQIEVRSCLGPKMLKAISLLLNSIDKYTKKIILSRYFYHFAFFIRSSPKKGTYLCQQHLKMCNDRFTLKFILKTKLKQFQRNKATDSMRKLAAMKLSIQSYHENLRNIY